NNNTLCFTTQLESQRYAELNVKGIQNLRLETPNGTHIRSLLKDIPADGQQKVRFLLPETASYQLVAQGEKGKSWQLIL
ncbi:hypothetical protein Q0M91_14700, partial [Staphylococcus aureus]|nr:hypothetical protein [Staphylococcus aureus]